jgi:hypothetical protein
MNLTSYILEQAFKQLKLPESSQKQFRIASALSDVGGNGFPKELFQLSAPVVVRGLLNYATLQMNRDWIYPYWVHRQLDPNDASFIPRSQNPLLLNVTHRNWTALGSPNGFHEAIVDPRGLVTPLPREWSLDVWIMIGERLIVPSLASNVRQQFEVTAPRLTTVTKTENLELRVEHFVDSTNREVDVLFQRARIKNESASRITGFLCIAIRPFNPEGVAPVHWIEYRQRRFAYVDKVLGLAFAKPPDWVICSNATGGDTASILRKLDGGAPVQSTDTIECRRGLANALAAFHFEIDPQQQFAVDCSVALGSERVLRNRAIKQSWRVSFEQRKDRHAAHWAKELDHGAQFDFADSELQNIFDASRLTLVQLQDNEFISPGPFLYHHFWFRDAVPMVRVLNLLGFPRRAQEVIDAFPKRLRADGFFRGPDGEWDSNGAVLWLVYHHYLLTRSTAWLQTWYPRLSKGANWIAVMRRKTSEDGTAIRGLMPPSLSAEHLGTVDQYFWDSFWSLAGLRSLTATAGVLGNEKDRSHCSSEQESLENDIRSAIELPTKRLGRQLIPSTPTRAFDESAIGSIASVYPLEILTDLAHPANTVRELDKRYVDARGFFHPIIHSGYNPYLTLQLAHSYLFMKDTVRAWEVAETIFRQSQSPYSLPEAIHPKTGGGSMGDGHHGWAAAEIILFLRDCLVKETEGKLVLFGGANNRLVRVGKKTRLENVPTNYGTISATIDFESEHRCVLQIQSEFFADHRPVSIEVILPFASKRVAASLPDDLLGLELREDSTAISCSSVVRTLFIEL